MNRTELTCISCPMGCRLSVEYDDSKIVSVENNRCKRGIQYAADEIFNPTRVVTTTVKTNSELGLLPVKTASSIPRHLIDEVMKELAGIVVTRHVSVGDVVKENICGTHINVVATRNI